MPERDSIDRLRNFPTEGTAMNQLSPSETRREGDTRRRHRIIGVTGAAAAVILIAGGGIIASGILGGDDDGDRDPAASSSTSATASESTEDPAAPYSQNPDDLPTAIPDSVDLTNGWPAGGAVKGPNDSLPSLQLSACGKEPQGSPSAASRETAVRTSGDDVRERELNVFPGKDEATDYLRTLRKVYASCPTQNDGNGKVFTEVRDLENGDEAFDAAQRIEEGAGNPNRVALVKVVRVGNAVVIDTGSTTGEATGPIVTEHGRQLVALVESICVFAVEGCDGNG